MVTKNFQTIGFVLLLVVYVILEVETSVSSFRVYNEKQILDRLASAPVVSLSLSRRTGLVTTAPESKSSLTLLPDDTITKPKSQKESNGKRKRIRKVIRKLKQRTTTVPVPIPILTTETPNPLTSSYDISPFNNYNNRDIEIYDRKRTRKYANRQNSKEIDLQRAESGNPFANSSAPISSDFAGDGGLQFQIQILHPLLNSDSLLSHKEPKIPENKTIKILHSLSEEVAGEVPVTPDLKKHRRKYPLLNQDSNISGDVQVSKAEPVLNHIKKNRTSGKISSKIKQPVPESGVTFVEALDGRTVSTTYPTITSQTIPVVTRPKPPTTTTPRPTIRLTNPPRIITTTTTTEKPSTVILSPVPFTTISPDGIEEFGNPQVIVFPPQEISTAHALKTTTPIPSEQDILNQILGLRQASSRLPSNQNNQQSTTNFFDFFNLLQSTTPSTITSFIPTTVTPVTTSHIIQSQATKSPPTRLITEIYSTSPTTQQTPPQSQAELDNLLQLALLEGLLKEDSQQPNTPNDLSSLYSLLGTQHTGNGNPVPQSTRPPPTRSTFTTSTPLQAALSNMISILSNPFGQNQNPTTQRPLGIFGTGNSIFGNGGGGSLFGGGSSIFSGGNNGGNTLFGGNSLFNLNHAASGTTTTVAQRPNTTPSPTLSNNDLLAELYKLGLTGEQPQRKITKPPTKSKVSGPDIQSIQNTNWHVANGGGRVASTAQPQTSETMQLLNILFNNQNAPARPSGPYWWLDMNAFMGGNPTADPMTGIRPKLGQREYFIKV